MHTKYFFESPERIAQLQFHAGLWIGTPFMPHGSTRGGGVCCQRLVGSLYKELGFLPEAFEIPTGPMDWSHAQTKSLIADFMAGCAHFAEIASAGSNGARPGDMVGFTLGGCLHHCGIVIAADGQFIHCLRGPGVLFSSLRDASYMSRLEKIWRPLA